MKKTRKTYKKKAWTAEDDAYLQQHFANTKTEALAAYFGVSYSAVSSRASSLNLKKSNHYLKKHGNRLDGVIGCQTRFKKGQPPWNKGMKGLQMGGVETQFKKGNAPHNTKHDGAISIRKHKGVPYQYIRVAKAMWQMLHVYVWEEVNGAVPSDKIIVFKDKNTMNCDLDNLEMIDRKENMRRNSSSVNMKDGFIAQCIVGSRNVKDNPELFDAIKENKQLLEVKRQQLLLNRELNKSE